MNNLLKLIASLALTLGTGALGSIFTLDVLPTWYASLNKPFFTPPDSFFGPIWSIFYVLMGISFYLVWISKKKNKYMAMWIFLIHLFLNLLWSIIFFWTQNPSGAFAEIIFLLVFIYLTIKEVGTISNKAAYLLYPYFMWVIFASILNLSIVILN